MAITENDVLVLKNGSLEDCSEVMTRFIANNEKRTSFEEVTLDLKKSLYDVIFARISDPDCSPGLVHSLLSSLRILCRELVTLDQAMTENHIQVILEVSKLKTNTTFDRCGDPEALEALKVIFNMTFQSALLRSKFILNGLLEKLVESIALAPVAWEIKYFRMRILFIMTALVTDCVATVRDDLNGLNILIDDLQSHATKSESFADGHILELMCEILKVVYNLMHNYVSNDIGADMCHQKALNVVKVFLFYYSTSLEKKDDLQSHSVDLLAVIPHELFDSLLDVKAGEQFNGYDMSAIESLVMFLDRRLDVKPGTRSGSLTELLSPVLSVLVRMASTNPRIRKYLKLRVLPPLRKADVIQRPEVGTTLRNKLCVLMTSSASPVTNLVCTFLFILVKENVQRFIKYTGFGNAAGLLANRGLLGGGRPPKDGTYSSESEDSDTEEYKEVSHLINGFGWIEPEHPPPCSGMTEEQKEVEAMKLVDAIDRLNRNQLIQPMQINRDGRLQPVEHVCQLLDHSNDSLVRSHQRRGSDSSDSN